MAVERSFTSLGSRVIDLEEAARDRLEDAEQLQAAGRYSSSILMGIYALEITLKARICRLLDLQQLPRPFEIHNLEGLLIASGLSHVLTKRNARRVKNNWSKVVEMAEKLGDLRYLPNLVETRQECEELVVHLTDPQDGVIPWISRQT